MTWSWARYLKRNSSFGYTQPMAETRVPRNGTLIGAALILGASSLASRIVGLVRERVFTTTFGAGDTFDAFVAAFRIPDLVFNLIVIGALSAAFIPLFTEKLIHTEAGGKRAFAFANSILNAMVVAVAVLMVLFVLLADVVVPVITPGFSGEKLELTILLSRVMALQPVLLAVSFVFSGVLNSYKRFAAYAAAPVLYNVGIIIGVLILVPYLGPAGIGWGVVLGAALHMLIQLPSMVAVGWRWQPIFNWQSGDIRTLWRMMLPRVFGLAAQQVNLLVVTVIGSTLLAGSISAFHLANNVAALPIGIFGLAFAQAAFPTLAEQVARKREQEFRRTLTRTFRYILFFVIPVSVFFFLLRAQIIRVLFGDGAFDWEDTILTFETFGWLIVSIFAQATVPLLTRAFYVRQDTLTPVVISTLSILFNIGLAIWLAPSMGVQGLALAFSAAAILNLVLLLGRLHWQMHGFDDARVLLSALRIAVAALVGGVVLQLLKYPVAIVVNMERFWGVAVQLGVAASGGVIVYIAVCWWLGCDELVAIRRYLPRRLLPPPSTETPRFGGLPE